MLRHMYQEPLHSLIRYVVGKLNRGFFEAHVI